MLTTQPKQNWAVDCYGNLIEFKQYVQIELKSSRCDDGLQAIKQIFNSYMEKAVALAPTVARWDTPVWLTELSLLKDGWDGYGATAPATKSIEVAQNFVLQSRAMDIVPSAIAPSVVGGVGVTYSNGNRMAYVEIANDGGVQILLAIEPSDLKPDVFFGSEKDIVQILRRVGMHLNASQEKWIIANCQSAF